MISYAQNFEDVMLWRALKHVKDGFYIDIGAQDPVGDSVSLAFYEHGWRGVHVEPTPTYAQALREARPDETVVQAAIGAEDTLISIYEIPNTGMSTGVAQFAEMHAGTGFPSNRIEVPCIRLAALFDRWPDREVHWLKIDVEGMEGSVLRSWSPSPVRPWIVLLEATVPRSPEPLYAEWEATILDLGYRFAYFDGLNRFYVSEAHLELLDAFKAPPNVFDGFALTCSHGFCDKRNPAIAALEARLAQHASQAEQSTQELSLRSEQVNQVRAQFEQARDETLQLLRHANAKDEAHAAQLAQAQADITRYQAELERARIEMHNAAQRAARTELDLNERLLREQETNAQRPTLQQKHEQDRAATAALHREERLAIEARHQERERAWSLLTNSTVNGLREQLETEQSVSLQLQHALNGLQRQLAEAHGSLLSRVAGLWRKPQLAPTDFAGQPSAIARVSQRAAAADLPTTVGPGTAAPSPLPDAGHKTPSLDHAMHNTPDATRAAKSIQELLNLNDEAFVVCAYWTILGREPDASGLRNYVDNLRSGVSKAQIVAEMALSPEGRVANIELAGLHATLDLGREDIIASRLTQAQPSAGDTLKPAVAEAPSSPNRVAATVEELLSQHDESFVLCTYRTILGREPDPSGFKNYLGQLRRGVAKGQIVAEIARSPEAQAKSNALPGLAETKWQYRRRLPSILGRVFRRAASSALEPLEMQLRSTENLLHRMREESLARFSRLEQATSEVQGLLMNATQAMQRLEPALLNRPGASPQVKPYPLRRAIYLYVDHTVACPTNTGMQRVTRRLADALLRRGESVTFVKWDAARRQFALLNRDELRYLGKWNGPVVGEAEMSRYPETTGPSRHLPLHAATEQIDWLVVPEVPHITFQSRPMTSEILESGRKLGLKLAFVFYDATPLRRPELKPMSAAHAEYMQQLMLADLVVPISKWVSNDLAGFLRHDQMVTNGVTPHIHAIPLPGESQLAPRVTMPSTADASAPYILSVGSIVPHKNQLTLVHAFDRYCAANPATPWSLKLAGNLLPDLSAQLASVVGRNPKIEYIGEVEDEQLIDLYKHCAFTVFPSVMEGFGLPILESLWFGKPCICANFGAMAEVAHGGGCLVVDTANINELQDAIISLTSSREKLSMLSEQARSRHIDSWHDYATSLLNQFVAIEKPTDRLRHIYYWIDHTVTYDGNSGIQRVTRGLARALLEQGLKVIPVKWSEQEKILIPAEDSDLTHFARWNGPRPSLWSQWSPLHDASPSDWLLIPELTHYLSCTGPRDIHSFCKKAGIRCSWIFHDAIPWKMTDIYPPEATQAHGEYMLALNGADKVLANSEFSRNDLLSFLGSTRERTGAIEKRVSACVLPGEFLEVERVRATKSRHGIHAIRILSVGTIEPRKNHLNLLRAVKLAQERSSTPIELTIAGGDSFPDLSRQVQQLVDSIPGATWARRVDDTGLQALYQNSDFTVYPSIAEGFGLPILESLWNARPCICANFGAMEEVAVGGGCLTVDMTDVAEIAKGILRLVNDPGLRDQLGQEASAREFKTWNDYGLEVAAELAAERPRLFDATAETTFDSPRQLYSEMTNLEKRPLLSICISTYNRAAWLSLSLRNIERLIPSVIDGVEILVCDNTSTDSTPDVVKPYLSRVDFRYVRNPENVGMLGNLRVTANQARGKYIWILGDDDLLKPGSIRYVIDALVRNPGIALLYLNYAYTREDNAALIDDLDKFLNESTPIVDSGPDIAGSVRDICTQSENFFTAIYCLVFRRDHAIRAYSQDTSGRPFSTLLTCIPTTYHVLHHMMDEPAYWVGTPQLVVNMNVSWMRYAPLWILERIPEVFNLAERYGADPTLIDRWRVHNIPGILHFYQQIFVDDPEGNSSYVSISRLVNSFKHLQEFRAIVDSLKEIYENAHNKKHPLAADSPDLVFSAFN